jgi:hypothetical protein
LSKKLVQTVSDHISAPNVSIDDSAGTSDFKLGDRVFGLAYGGAVSKAFIEEQEASNFLFLFPVFSDDFRFREDVDAYTCEYGVRDSSRYSRGRAREILREWN